MKKFLLGSALAILSSGVALATDLPIKAPARMYNPTPAYSWSGVYGGISGGYGWGQNKILDTTFNPSQSPKPSGGFGGVQIGYNSQFAPHWLVGGEIDLSFGDMQDDINVGGQPMHNSFNSFGTARTRFGYVQDRWLAYGTLGAIWLYDKYLAPGMTDTAQYHVGWVFGGGLEYAVDDRWSWKLEYLYAPFDRSRDSIINSNTFKSWDASFNVVRAGLNYRFGDGGASNATNAMPAKAAASRFGWNGSYLGVHGGYGSSKLYEALYLIEATPKPDGWYGGFQGGYNWQCAPQAVFGFEIDSSFGDLKGNAVSVPALATTINAKIDSLGTARLRLGYLMTPDTLLYATGGAAYAREKLSFRGGLAGDTKADHLGWTAGGGVEWKFAPEWSVKAEYLYADLGRFKDNNTFVIAAPLRNSDLTLSTVRVGINYSGPVIERLFAGN
jgi:outer membrane immunogenic protein